MPKPPWIMSKTLQITQPKYSKAPTKINTTKGAGAFTSGTPSRKYQLVGMV